MPTVMRRGKKTAGCAWAFKKRKGRNGRIPERKTAFHADGSAHAARDADQTVIEGPFGSGMPTTDGTDPKKSDRFRENQ